MLERCLKWLDEFKIAVIEEDISKIETLIDNIPQFHDIKSSELALTLINEARVIIKRQKDDALSQMQKIQKTKKFVESCESAYSLDMSS